MQTHTQTHTVRDRPILKDLEPFQTGSLCEFYERSIYSL